MKAILLFGTGFLVGAVTLAVALVFLIGALDEGCQKCKFVRVQLMDIGTALNLYKEATGHYPEDVESLVVLADGYLKSLPLDPWGRPFHYATWEVAAGSCFGLWSYGADGATGGKSEANADVFVDCTMRY